MAYDAGAIVALLPPDDAIQGFDNVAAALTVSPTLIESYVNAAQKISRAAIGDRSQGPTQISYAAPGGSQAAHVDGLPLGTRGGFKVTHHFPLDAAYEIRVRARGFGALAGQRFCTQPRIDITLDGAPLAVDDPAAHRLRVAGGPHTLTVALLDERRCEGVNELYGVYAAGGGIDSIEIHGPFEASGTGDTPSRRAVFTCVPPRGGEHLPCAREILSRLATRAYRRPVDTDDEALETLLRFYEQGRHDGGFEAGIEQALARVLIDPRFLYRFEAEPDGLAAGEALSRRRLRARVALVVLPLEQHPGRRAARGRGRWDTARAGRARAPSATHARRRALASARREFRRPVAEAARARRRLTARLGFRREPA